MKKKLILIVFILLIFSLVFLSIGIYAQDNEGGSGGLAESLANSGIPKFITDRLEFWELGIDKDKGLDGVTIKYLFLALVIMLIYSALTYVNFPDSFTNTSSGIVRFIISFITGALATFAITTNELLSILQSYTALGITLSLFFPIAILLFFTLVTARKASPIGIFASRILWIIYATYLLIKSSIVFFATRAVSQGAETAFLESNITRYFIGDSIPTLIQNKAYDPTITIIVLIISISIFAIFVFGGKWIQAWLAKEERDAEIEAQKAMIQRSHAYDKARSEQLQRT